ncbi:MAG: hypothetical protein NVS3B23_09380 [Candidatus Saccharimonadales bacterium]
MNEIKVEKQVAFLHHNANRIVLGIGFVSMSIFGLNSLSNAAVHQEKSDAVRILGNQPGSLSSYEEERMKSEQSGAIIDFGASALCAVALGSTELIRVHKKYRDGSVLSDNC